MQITEDEEYDEGFDEDEGPHVQVLDDNDTPVYVYDVRSPAFEIIEEEDAVEEADDEFYPKFRAVANLAAPSVVCTMAVFMKDIVNLYFVAQLGDLALMQAVGLGNVIVNTFIIGAGLSLNTSVENLVSQALGAGKLELCGHYLNRGILAWTLAFFALCPLLIYSKAILLAIGIDLEIAMRSEQYLLCSIPGLFMWGMCDIYRRFFNCFWKTSVPMKCCLVALLIHPAVVYFLAVHHGMGLQGVAASSFVTNSLTFAMMRIALGYQADMQEANFAPTLQTFVGLRTFME